MKNGAEMQTSKSAIIKRINLLILIVTAALSCLLGYFVGSDKHSLDTYIASSTTWRDTIVSDSNSKDWVDVPLSKEEQATIERFNPDKYLYENDALTDQQKSAVRLAVAKRLSEVSLVQPILYGVGVGLSMFGSVIILMMTVSWLLGYKFKLHISTN